MLKRRLQAFTRLSENNRTSIDHLSGKCVREWGAKRDLIHEGDRPRSVFVMLEG